MENEGQLSIAALLTHVCHSAWLLAAGDSICEEAQVGIDNVMFEVGRLARTADGACVVSLGQTQVLATVWARTRDAWMRRDADRQLQARSYWCNFACRGVLLTDSTMA